MAYLSKKHADKTRSQLALLSGAMMIIGAAVAWGPGGALFAAGGWLLAIAICEEITTTLKN